MPLEGKDITEKFTYLKDEREPYEHDWKEINRFVVPRRSIWDNNTREGDRVGQKIFDGTAISAVNLLANGLMGYLMSPMLKWFKLGLPNLRAMDLPGVREWLELCENILYNDFARSPLYQEGLEFFKDGASVATASMFMEEDLVEGVPFFSSRHPKEIYIDVDRRNRPDTVFRYYYLTARTMEQEFGYKNLPENVQQAAEHSPYEKFPVIHAVFPRTDRDVTKLNARNKKYASVYVDEGSGEILREGGFDQLPYIVWRWSTNSDERYGRGPSHDALSKIKRANSMSKTLMEYANMAAAPPYNVPEHMRDQVKLLPRGLNYFNSPDDIISPVPLGGQYPIARDQEQDIREIIEADYMVDFFLMLQRAPEKMTATEVMERQAEKAAVLGPVIGGIESEVLDKVIDLAFRQAVKAGRIPPPPPALRRIMNMPIKIEYIGPLAQANRKFHVQQGIMHAIQQFAPLLEVYPEMRGLIKPEQLGREILEHGGMPAGIVRDQREFNEWLERMNQKQQELEQRQVELEAMQNSDKLAKAPEPGSPLEQLDQNARGVMRQMQGVAQ